VLPPDDATTLTKALYRDHIGPAPWSSEATVRNRSNRLPTISCLDVISRTTVCDPIEDCAEGFAGYKKRIAAKANSKVPGILVLLSIGHDVSDRRATRYVWRLSGNSHLSSTGSWGSRYTTGCTDREGK
jgi:hypothetical protein